MRAAPILPAIHARLAAMLGAPHPRYRPWEVDGHAVGWLDDMRASRLVGFGRNHKDAASNLRHRDFPLPLQLAHTLAKSCVNGEEHQSSEPRG